MFLGSPLFGPFMAMVYHTLSIGVDVFGGGTFLVLLVNIEASLAVKWQAEIQCFSGRIFGPMES
jgi:hypothetical protein